MLLSLKMVLYLLSVLNTQRIEQDIPFQRDQAVSQSTEFMKQTIFFLLRFFFTNKTLHKLKEHIYFATCLVTLKSKHSLKTFFFSFPLQGQSSSREKKLCRLSETSLIPM